MPIDLQMLCRELQPSKTILLFGSGSSIPSGAPSTQELAKAICEQFVIDYDPTLTLGDVATLGELKRTRRELVTFLVKTLERLVPTRGLLNLPLYGWKSLATTNYDSLIELSYKRSSKPLSVASSNFDFDSVDDRGSTPLFKVHGTLERDRSIGHTTSMVITNEDYDVATQYRELVFDRLLHETSKNDVIVIGHSLSDPDLNVVLNEAARRKRSSGASGKLYALVYTPDANRAALLEQKGYSVCFGGLDDFFLTLNTSGPAHRTVHTENGDLLDLAPNLRPATVDVGHSIQFDNPDAVELFNGARAQYGDIQAELTFSRDLSPIIEGQLAGHEKPVAYILGPAGFGKTTVGRQVAFVLSKRGFQCWEHNSDYRFEAAGWIKIAAHCAKNKINALLFVDDAHIHLRELDNLVDELASNGSSPGLRLVLASAPGKWHIRTKTPNLYRIGTEYAMRRLSNNEINSLLDLFERKREIALLVEANFSGFSRQDKLRRLSERCRSDMFVCLKNIFGFDSLNDIILQDYAAMDTALQDVYKVVAAMEASNIRVHRQLVMRVLGIRADFIQGILQSLTGTISEETVHATDGIYAWRGRHPVISAIILRYKFNTQEELFNLYSRVTEFINPTYEIERITIDEMCDIHDGIGRIQDKARQNHLYRKLMSVAPGQRVPRHRLIYNLIKGGDFEQASNEIRIFEKELRRGDAPIVRFKAMVQVERAKTVIGLMVEDRVVILREAIGIADGGLTRYPVDKSLYNVLCDAALEILRLTGRWEAFDAAIERLEKARAEYLDPEMGRMLGRLKSRAEGFSQSVG